MKIFKELDNRIVDGELMLSDILVIAAIIFVGILDVFALLGSLICSIAILVFVALYGNAVKLLMLIPCAAIFSISFAIALFAGINFATCNYD